MNSAAPAQKTGSSQIVKLNNALKLAQQWVNNMTTIEEDEPVKEPEGRPPRLGLGAKVPRQIRTGPSNDPLDRALYAKLEAGKRKAAQTAADTSRVYNDDGDEDSDDSESRTTMFDKKRATVPPAASLGRKKKRK